MSSRGWYRDFGRYEGPADALDVINEDVPVTAEMYSDFTRYFRLWCGKLGLRHLELIFVQCGHGDDSAASVCWQEMGTSVLVHCSTTIPKFVAEMGMEALALHEVLHLLFMDMETLALGSRKGLSEEKLKELFDRQTHYVIQRLVGAML